VTRLFSTFCLATLAFTTAAGCGSKPAPGPLGAAPAEAPKTVSHGPPVTEGEAQAFAREIESTVEAGDAAAFGKLLRIEALIDRSVSDLQPNASFMAGLKSGITQTGNKIAAQILDAKKKGGSYTFIRVRTVDGSPRPLFRFLLPDVGVNYHDFELTRLPDGTVGTEDLHVALTGEPLSQTFRRLIVPMIRESKQGLYDRISGKDRIYLDNSQKVKQIGELKRQGQFRECLNLIQSLPVEIEKEKAIQIIAINAAQQVSDDEFMKAMERFRELHPNDPVVDMLSMDYFGLRKQFDKAHASIDRLDKAVGGDPYLQYMHGGIDILAEKWPEARARFAKAKIADPTMTDAYIGDISVSLKMKDHKATLAGLKEVAEKRGVDINLDNIRTDENYREFAQSPQFNELAAWIKKRNP
jgi:hypothetical protein